MFAVHASRRAFFCVQIDFHHGESHAIHHSAWDDEPGAFFDLRLLTEWRLARNAYPDDIVSCVQISSGNSTLDVSPQP